MEDKNQTNTNPVVSGGTNVNPEPAAAAADASQIIPAESITDSMSSVVTEAVPVTTFETSVTTAAVSSTRATILKQYTIAIAVILVIGGGLWYALEQQGRVHTGVFDSVIALVKPVPVAAVVNGVKIPLADYEKNKLQLEQAATQGGNDPKNASIAEQINKQAIDVLVNTELLRQEAGKAGLTVTEEQIKARYDEIVKGLQGEDKLNERMAELGMTKENLMKDIAGEILIQSYLTKEVDVTAIKIEEKDIKTVYDQANTNPESPLPPYDQVKAAIEGQLRTTKEQELVNAFIEKIRETATIEVKI